MMKDDSPYWTRHPKEIAREQACMRAVFRHAREVPMVFEAFGGIGVTAQVLIEAWPGVHIIATDLDAKCVEQYNAHGWALARSQVGDAVVVAKALYVPGGSPWGASLDYNKFTIMDLHGRSSGRWKVELLREVMERKPAWVQITDSAIRYLHLNWERYGCDDKGLDAYLAVLGKALYEQFGLVLKSEAHHSAATYILLENTNA
jgi:hypothetical protein